MNFLFLTPRPPQKKSAGKNVAQQGAEGTIPMAHHTLLLRGAERWKESSSCNIWSIRC